MSLTDQLLTARVFGAGGDDPYARALELGHGRLRLERNAADTAATSELAQRFEVRGFLAPATEIEVDALARTDGAVLDVGSGPGRVVAAALRSGRIALGIDVSPTAVAAARASGTPVLRRSIFEPLPREGHWGTVILLDGNIGIGGDPRRLLARCTQLVQYNSRSTVLVETAADAHAHEQFDATLVDEHGRRSGVFPWAIIGHHRLRREAGAAGLVLLSEWAAGGRHFAILAAG